MIDLALVLIVVSALCVVIALQQWQNNKLINKLMSRNFHEYQSAVQLTKTTKKVNPAIPMDAAEDLRDLQGIGSGF